jgi:tetratricopeptide (TPR) repeat protein
MTFQRPSVDVSALVVATCCVLVPLAGCQSTRGPDARTVKWLNRLDTGDNDQRENAVRVLAQKKGQELYVVPALIKSLDDRDPIVAKSAAEGLRMLLGKPDLSDQKTVWEEYWKRTKAKYESAKKRTPEERIKIEKAALENDRGYLQMTQGRFKKAEGFFLEAVALDPEDPKYWNNLGKCRKNMGMLPDAVDSFRKALDRDATYGPAHFNLGETFLEISRVTGFDRTYEALGHAEAAVRIDTSSKDWAARWLRARILLNMAVAANDPGEREAIYKESWDSITEAIGIVELTRSMSETAQVRKTAALIAYGRELYYRAYKEMMRVHELGYTMDKDFMAKLEQALKREAYATGAEPPKMPEFRDVAEDDLPPPALRMPYGND